MSLSGCRRRAIKNQRKRDADRLSVGRAAMVDLQSLKGGIITCYKVKYGPKRGQWVWSVRHKRVGGRVMQHLRGVSMSRDGMMDDKAMDSFLRHCAVEPIVKTPKKRKLYTGE